MHTKWILLLAAGLLLLWVFGDWSSYPNLRDVYVIETDSGASNSSTTRISGSNILRSSDFASVEEFEAWQSKTRAVYLDLLNLPAEGVDAPRVQVLRRMPAKQGLVREYLEFEMTDGVRIPAVVQYPKDATNSPAVLVISGHTKLGESGLSQLIDKEESYQHAAATRLAKAGYVTIAIELRGFGLLGPPHYPEHKIVAYNQLLRGSNYKAVVLRDLRQVLAYLQRMEITDRSRVGVAGASLGGELSVALGASEPSVKAVAFSSHFAGGAFKPFNAGFIKQPHYCHLIPNIGSIMRKEDVFKLIAPRPLIGIREVTRKDQYDSIVKDLENTWQLYDRETAFEFIKVVNGGHEFYVDETIRFFNKHL